MEKLDLGWYLDEAFILQYSTVSFTLRRVPISSAGDIVYMPVQPFDRGDVRDLWYARMD